MAPSRFSSFKGSADLPKISAIKVAQASGVGIQISPTSVNLSASQAQQFTATVTGTTNAGVNWSMSPAVGTLSNGLYTAPSSITVAQAITVTATSQADTTKSASATVNLQPPAGSFAAILVHAGGGAYTDSLGQNWSADTDFTGGNTSSTTHAISNTPAPALYQTERYGVFSYGFTVPNGNYNVLLKFAEIYWSSAGQRMFNVSINGTQVLTNFDIVAQAGAPFTALDKTFPVTVSNGTITIQFIQGSADLPKISAIKVAQASGVGIQISPTSVNLSASQTQQFTATVTGTTNAGVNWSMSPAVGTLSNGLYTAPSSITVAQAITVTATSQADTTKSASATVNLQPPASSFAAILVHAGGGAYTDSLGQNWSADTDFTGGNTFSTTHAISNTPDPALYQTERYGVFSYGFTVPNGNYNVLLKFAEIYWSSAGQRMFNVSINGTQVLTNFDIVAQAGAPFTALDKTFPVTVSNGTITVQFIQGKADLPKVSAIEIH